MHSARQKAPPARLRTGFTLVEILAVLAVGGLLLTLLAQILGGGFSIWGKVHDSLDTESEARTALERLARDLQAYVGDARDGESFRLVRNPDSVGPGGAEAKHADWLMWISSPMDRDMDDPTGVCAVSYRLVYGPVPGRDGDTENMFSLRRRLVDSGTTFREILEEDNDLASALDEDAPSKKFEEVIASHVIDFHITPVFRSDEEEEAEGEGEDAGGTRRYRMPDASRVTVADEEVEATGGGTSPPEGSVFQGVEISLSVLRASGLTFVQNGAESGEIAPGHIATFSQFVAFPIPPGKIE